jgi:hypothetical protein
MKTFYTFLYELQVNLGIGSKAITKEENYDVQAKRLKRFIESIVFYN